MQVVSECNEMVARMQPVLDRESYVFCSTTDGKLAAQLIPHAKCLFHEAEGWTLILLASLAEQHGFDASIPMALITLNVYSALEGVGLTAAVSTKLAQNAIPCNITAAFHHDHFFVPHYLGAKAMRLLRELQQSAQAALDSPPKEEKPPQPPAQTLKEPQIPSKKQ